MLPPVEPDLRCVYCELLAAAAAVTAAGRGLRREPKSPGWFCQLGIWAPQLAVGEAAVVEIVGAARCCCCCREVEVEVPGRELELELDGCPAPAGGGGSWPFGGGKAVPDLGDDASLFGLPDPLVMMLAGAAKRAAPAELLDVRAPYVAELAGVRAAPLGWYACGRRES